MSQQSLVQLMNENPPPCLQALGAKTVSLDQEQRTVIMSFDIPLGFCHSGNIIQGGFVTGMLDAAMSHAAFGTLDGLVAVPSLEIKVSFLAPSLAGKFRAEGRVLQLGKSIAFLEASLFNAEGELTATSTSTAKIVRAKT